MRGGGLSLIWNTHFDDQIQAAREKAAKLGRERVAALDTKQPLTLPGDLNAAGGTNAARKILTARGFFADTWMTAKERKGEGLNTSHGLQAIRRNGVRIGRIPTRGGLVEDCAEIVTFQLQNSAVGLWFIGGQRQRGLGRKLAGL